MMKWAFLFWAAPLLAVDILATRIDKRIVQLNERLPDSLYSSVVCWAPFARSTQQWDYSRTRSTFLLSNATWSADGSLNCNAAGYAIIPGGGGFTMGTNSFTLSAWVKYGYPKANALAGIAGRTSNSAGNYGRYGMYCMSNSPFNFGLEGNARATSHANANIDSNIWYMFTATAHRQSTACLYVDGASNGLVAISASATNNFGANFSFKAGAYGNGYVPNWFFPGSIDDVMVFDRVLTPAEVALLFKYQRRGKK